MTTRSRYAAAGHEPRPGHSIKASTAVAIDGIRWWRELLSPEVRLQLEQRDGSCEALEEDDR